MNHNPVRNLNRNPFSSVAVSLVLVVAVSLCVGCASPGGLVVGPSSYYSASKNETAMSARSVMLAREIQPEQKQQLLKAVNLGIRPGEFAMAVGVDLAAIPETSMTWSEILKNAVGVIVDAGIYTGIGYGVSQIGSSGDSSPSYNFTFQGPVNNSSFQSGSPSATQQHSREDNSTGKGAKK